MGPSKLFIFSLISYFCLVSAAPVYHETGSWQAESGYVCHNLTIPISLQQTATRDYNMDNYAVEFFYDMQDFKLFRTATYNVIAVYCAPPKNPSGNARDTIQLLNHGGTFKKEHWDFPYQPEKYSWVRAMHAAGYPTLAWDQIGCGESEHPDPLFDVQTQSIVESARYLASMLKRGEILGNAYKNVALVGFSIGAVAAVSQAAQYPESVEALILHGFSWDLTNLYPGYLTGLQAPANSLEKPEWRNLSSLYLSQSTPQSRQAVVFYGDFDPAVVPVDFEIRDIDATGLALSFGYHLVTAPKFTGAVFIGNGNQDSSFCGRECGSKPYAAYDRLPLASDIDIKTYNGSGHGIHMHNCAQQLQRDTVAFLQRNGM